MERFRLRARHEPVKGLIWELKLFPDNPRHIFREADGRVLGEVASPESVLWLRHIAEPFLGRAEPPADAETFGPNVEPRWLQSEDGMRLALAFSAARYLPSASQRRRFREGLQELPSEVLLYWFTLCYYGYHQAAGRAALRTLLAYAESDFNGAYAPKPKRAARRQRELAGPTLFDSLDTGPSEKADEEEEPEESSRVNEPEAPAEGRQASKAAAQEPGAGQGPETAPRRRRETAGVQYKTRRPVKRPPRD